MRAMARALTTPAMVPVSATVPDPGSSSLPYRPSPLPLSGLYSPPLLCLQDPCLKNLLLQQSVSCGHHLDHFDHPRHQPSQNHFLKYLLELWWLLASWSWWLPGSISLFLLYPVSCGHYLDHRKHQPSQIHYLEVCWSSGDSWPIGCGGGGVIPWLFY